MESASPVDLLALRELLRDPLGLRRIQFRWRVPSKKSILGFLWALGLPDLHEVTEALAAGHAQRILEAA